VPSCIGESGTPQYSDWVQQGIPRGLPELCAAGQEKQRAPLFPMFLKAQPPLGEMSQLALLNVKNFRSSVVQLRVQYERGR
jgi:hypothetical protein